MRPLLPTSLHMIARSLQLFCVVLVCGAATVGLSNELKTGSVASLTFEDVDGNQLSTADGHVTIITVVTQSNGDQSRAIADQVPDRYVGDPKYRYVTLVNFQGKLWGPLQGITRGVIRGRLDGEAKEVKPQYEAKHLTRDPRKDMYVIADFDGKAVTQLGLSPESNEISVFVFDGRGKVVHRWNSVPPNDSLGNAIAAAAGAE
jgi:hypothetical protein